MATLQKTIQKAMSNVFRRAYIKRMQSDGTYESNWVEITDDVKSFGKVSIDVDTSRFNKIRFGSNSLKMNNEIGKYNPESDDNSLWLNYASQQRTLVKIEAGYRNLFLDTDGRWSRHEYGLAYYDRAYWDAEYFDNESSVVYKGVISGDIYSSDKNEVNLNIMPLMEIFRQYPSSLLTGFTNTGVTASQFCDIVWNQTDGGGSYIFRPFFENTTTYWDIQTTTSVYSNLNTNTSSDVIDWTVWDTIEKLASAENFVAYVNKSGVFKFKDRNANTTTSAFEFNGPGIQNDSEYGVTIKKIDRFGPKFSKYYSRVSLKWQESNTTTSYEILSASLTVSGGSTPWILGYRTLSLNNVWIPNSSIASSLATNIYNDVSALKRELDFSTQFLTSVDILDRIKVTYDSSPVSVDSLWDIQNWGQNNDTVESAALYWDSTKGDALKLNSEEFNIISVQIDLDKLETKYIARET